MTRLLLAPTGEWWIEIYHDVANIPKRDQGNPVEQHHHIKHSCSLLCRHVGGEREIHVLQVEDQKRKLKKER